MFLTSCCTCSLSGIWDPALSPAQILSEEIQLESSVRIRFREMIEKPAKTGLMLMVIGTTVGGLAMAVFGLGLQSDKPRAAWGAIIAVCAQELLLLAAGLGLWSGDASILSRVWHLLLTIVTTVTLGFCVVALKQVMKEPPRSGLEVLPKDFEC